MTAAILDRSPAPPPQLSGAVEAAGSRGYGHFGPTSTLAYTTTTSSPPPLTALAPTGTSSDYPTSRQVQQALSKIIH